NSSRDPADGRTYSISTLYYWARCDNPEEYLNLIRDNMVELLDQAVDGNDFDVATVVHEMYKYDYKCTDLKEKVWYEFVGHRWKKIPQGFSLDIKLSTEMPKEFAKLCQYYLE